jgi:polysaccharide export outer membrane protein
MSRKLIPLFRLAAVIAVLSGIATLAPAAGLKTDSQGGYGALPSERSTDPATTGAHPGPLSSPRLTVDAGYRLSPGDVIQLVVFGEPTQSGTFAIGPAGSIAMPIVGQITLRGLTIHEAEQLVTTKLHQILRNPQVTITFNELSSVRKVYLSGEMMRTGAVTLPFGATLVDALSAVPPGPYADLRRIRLTHPGGQPVEVDCSGLRGEGPLPIEHRLEYGDTIFAPRVREEISIFGEVRNPGTVLLPVGQDVTVLDALRVAQGFTPVADRTRALLLREGSEPVQIDLGKLLQGGDTTENRRLQGGDVLVVPQTGGIAVVGQVRTPWVLPAGGAVPVLQALAQAGGPLPTGDLSQAQIIRNGKGITVDLQTFMDKGTAPAEFNLQPGDVLLIPRGEGQNVLLVGVLGRTGVFPLRGVDQRDLLRVITLAGPVAQSDLTRVTVYRGNQALIRNLKAMMDNGDLSQNLDLEPGDMVMVPPLEVDSVLLTGMLARQGVFQVLRKDPHDLLRVITVAGAGAMSDLSRVTIYRGGQTIVRDMKAALEKGDLQQSIEVEDGDVIYVPPIEESVVLTGAVQRSGIVRLIGDEQRDLSKLVLLSGPLGVADLSKVTVTRGAEKIVVNVRDYVDKGDARQTLRLQDGDMVRVPMVEDSVLLTGALNRGGVVRLYEGLDRDLISLVLAAGPTAMADLEHVTVFRGEQKTVRNLRAMVEGGDRSQTMELEPGDIITVPPRQIHTVLLTGALGRPGLVNLIDDRQRDLARLISAAGPLPNADLSKVAVRRGGLTTTRDIQAYIDTALPQHTLQVEDGDVVVVPRGESTVLIMGSVVRAGTLQLYEDKQRDLMRVVVLAGPTPNADLSKVTIYRGDQTIVRDLRKLYDTGDLSQTMLLQDGDIVKVPAFEDRILIAGAAGRLGAAALGEKEARDLVRVVQTASPLPYANLRKVSVLRGNQTITRDVFAYLQKGDKTQTLELEDGDVVLIPYDRETAMITGAVARAGSIGVPDPERADLAEVISAASPLPTADLRRVTIYRGEQQLTYDLSALRSGGDLPRNVPLLPGDRVFVPGLDTTTVLVTGSVQRTGTAELVTAEQRNLASFVVSASPLPTADLTRVIVYRGDTSTTYNLRAYLEKGDGSQTTELQDGDRVLVPEQPATGGIIISGQVNRQGTLPLALGQSPDLLSAVTLAGPLVATADLSQVIVYRGTEKIVRDLQKLREEGDLTQNLTLQAGDVVYVPEATDTVVFMGQVTRPGALNIHQFRQRDLAHLLPLAAPDANSDTEQVTIYRNGETIVRNYRDLVEKGDLTQNLVLEPGDYVYVPKDSAHDAMFLGALGRVGPVNVREPSSQDLLRVITALAPTPAADLTRITIFRGDEPPMYKDLKLLMDEGDMSQNIKIEPGDVVVVPRLDDLYILGAVGRAGAYAAQPDWDILDALAAAGNPVPAASGANVTIIRRRPDGTSERINFNLGAVAQGKAPEPIKVKAGDIIYVPYPKAKRGLSWNLIRDTIYMLGSLNDIFDLF